MNEIKKIGLFGFGTVGKGFYETLLQHLDLPVKIEKVCIKRLDLERIGHELYFTDEANEILDDEAIDIVIEVTDDPVAAKEIVRKALENGKAVVSANKKMIAESLEDVNHWHQEHPASFLYEAAVGGGIPIINTIDASFSDYGISKIRGILNGSSNYILSQMFQQNWSFQQALDAAQKNGFAESNPTLDISGLDASFKLNILAYHSFREIATLRSCVLESIEQVTSQDIRKAKTKGRKIKPVAQIERTSDGFRCSVRPEVIGVNDELFNVENENNAISIETELTGSHLLVGKGAGALPTGSAVFSDLKRILQGYKYQQSIRLQVA